MAYASVNNLTDLEEVSKDYKRYRKKKLKIKGKYSENIFPCYNQAIGEAKNKPTEEEIKKYRKYLKEIGDLLFQPNGSYQKFAWEVLVSKSDKVNQERLSRGRLHTIKY